MNQLFVLLNELHLSSLCYEFLPMILLLILVNELRCLCYSVFYESTFYIIERITFEQIILKSFYLFVSGLHRRLTYLQPLQNVPTLEWITARSTALVFDRSFRCSEFFLNNFEINLFKCASFHFNCQKTNENLGRKSRPTFQLIFFPFQYFYVYPRYICSVFLFLFQFFYVCLSIPFLVAKCRMFLRLAPL